MIAQKKAGEGTVWFYYDANGQRVAMDVSGTVYYYIYNAMGDVIGLYDGSGSVVARYAYDAWGRVITVKDGSGNILNPTSNPGEPGIINPFRYRGYMYDDESGLYYLNSRYYDPETGRFVNADAIATSDNLLGANLYAYCYNNPVNLCDPDGYNPLLGYGSRGSWVKTLQEMLNSNGYNLAVDGKYGPKTKAAVIGYQKAHGLKVDGLVGDETWGSLYRTTGDGTAISAPSADNYGNIYYFTYYTTPEVRAIKYTISQGCIHIPMKNNNIGSILMNADGFINHMLGKYREVYGHDMPGRTVGGIHIEIFIHFIGQETERGKVCDVDCPDHRGSQNWKWFELL